MAEATQKCYKCYKIKTLDETHFKKKANSSYGKTCIPCTDKLKVSRDNKKAEQSKENQVPKEATQTHNSDTDHSENGPSIEELRKELGNLSHTQFITALSAAEDIHSIAAFVDISEIEGKNMRERVDSLARMIWEQLGYRFVYVKLYILIQV